jgi:type IV pilus assembly protein PilW
MKTFVHRKAQRNDQAGFTMIELMIAMVIGLVLMGGVVSLFVGGQKSFRVDESVARMQDDARYAIHELARDLRMVGYLAEPMDPAVLNIAANTIAATDCGVAGQPDWILRMTDAGTGELNMLTGVDNATGATANAGYSCITGAEIVPGADVIGIKRFAGDSVNTAAVTATNVYLRSNGTVGAIYMAPLAGIPFPPAADNWEYRPRVYYIRNFSDTPGDNMPALCRKQLNFGNAGGTGIETECIASGIEDLQIEYGLDTTGSGSANRYLAAPTLTQLQQVVSVRVFLLARTLVTDFSYTDQRTYSLSNAPAYTPNDQFHRRLYTITVPVTNLRNGQVLGV